MPCTRSLAVRLSGFGLGAYAELLELSAGDRIDESPESRRFSVESGLPDTPDSRSRCAFSAESAKLHTRCVMHQHEAFALHGYLTHNKHPSVGLCLGPYGGPKEGGSFL
jgi:hypothetical protein